MAQRRSFFALLGSCEFHSSAPIGKLEENVPASDANSFSGSQNSAPLVEGNYVACGSGAAAGGMLGTSQQTRDGVKNHLHSKPSAHSDTTRAIPEKPSLLKGLHRLKSSEIFASRDENSPDAEDKLNSPSEDGDKDLDDTNSSSHGSSLGSQYIKHSGKELGVIVAPKGHCRQVDAKSAPMKFSLSTFEHEKWLTSEEPMKGRYNICSPGKNILENISTFQISPPLSSGPQGNHDLPHAVKSSALNVAEQSNPLEGYNIAETASQEDPILGGHMLGNSDVSEMGAKEIVEKTKEEDGRKGQSSTSVTSSSRPPRLLSASGGSCEDSRYEDELDRMRGVDIEMDCVQPSSIHPCISGTPASPLEDCSPSFARLGSQSHLKRARRAGKKAPLLPEQSLDHFLYGCSLPPQGGIEASCASALWQGANEAFGDSIGYEGGEQSSVKGDEEGEGLENELNSSKALVPRKEKLIATSWVRRDADFIESSPREKKRVRLRYESDYPLPNSRIHLPHPIRPDPTNQPDLHANCCYTQDPIEWYSSDDDQSCSGLVPTEIEDKNFATIVKKYTINKTSKNAHSLYSRYTKALRRQQALSAFDSTQLPAF